MNDVNKLYYHLLWLPGKILDAVGLLTLSEKLGYWAGKQDGRREVGKLKRKVRIIQEWL